LRSRFEGGLTIDIQKPDFELRTAILLIKAQQKSLVISMEVAQLIAGNLTSIRRIEGFLARLTGEAQLQKKAITSEFAGALLGKTSEPTLLSRPLRPRQILNTVASYFNLKQSDLTGPTRLQNIAEARQILMYLLRHELRIQLEEIGRLLGGRDHTTIMHGVPDHSRVIHQ
jgi:chromosomal replication initiator protein